jgi:tetratricopeptide (TPR) repeat protein
MPHARTPSTFWPHGSANGRLMHVAGARRGTASAPRSTSHTPTRGSAGPTPEELLMKAMAARSPAARERWARQGLATRGPLDRTTQAMLLRQLYLSHYETRRFGRAHAVALQALELNVLCDVLHQDAARAALAEGDAKAALSHLRRATRRAPASRRAFHLWTLGSALFLLHRYAESAAVLTRAVRWGTHDKPLYRAHLALVRVAVGEHVDDLQAAIDDLASATCGQGYGRFVLGHLAYAAGQWAAARRYLHAFIRRTEAARPALAIALDAEVRMARTTIAKMSAN